MQIDMERIKEAIYRAENGDALELIEIAKKLSSYGPLTALAAVMKHHKMLIDSTRGHIKILQRKDGFIISEIFSHDLCVLTADDIKPE
jgi:hypothetical protein